jgi:sugar phosphate isomerase/epimerase
MELLPTLGVNGVEVAPTKIADWPDLTDSMLLNFRRNVQNSGLVVSSLQAILFNRPSLQLLDNAEQFKYFENHFVRLIEIANILEAKILVFGSPKNRKLCGLSDSVGHQLALERLHQLGDIAHSAGIIIGIEPVPVHYGNEFLTSWRQVLDFVVELSHPGVGVHLDTGCVIMNGDVIEEAITSCANLICHFQVAQPQLTNFAIAHPDHSIAAKYLKKIDYSGWISLEMQEPEFNSIEVLTQAIKFISTTYLRDG